MMQKKIERKALIVGSIINSIITGAGVWVFSVTGIQALFLDCFFSFIALISSITAVFISKISRRKTLHYPNGLYFLEPLYAILKSLLTLSLLIVSVIGTAKTAYAYFFNGIGETMNTTPVLPYTVAMVILCFGLCIYNRRQNKKINGISTMLSAESKTNFIDGLQSAGIGVAVIILNFTKIDGTFGFLHYTGDFFITFILVLFSIKQPVISLITAFRELTGGTVSDKKIKDTINGIIERNFNGVIDNLKYDVFKIGMKIRICLYLNEGCTNTANSNEMKLAKERTLSDLSLFYENIEFIYCY